jgi:hypothetical protein
MKTGAPRFLRRSLSLAAAGILVAVLAACTGRGGGQLPPDNVLFSGPASFGFSFSCENGELRIQLDYTDHGSNPIGSSFSIHGIVDQVDPVLESAVCIDQNPPPPPENQLIFLGRYYLTSSAPAGFPSTCPTRETETTTLCRFEVLVQDNDRDYAPSPGDFFQIKLSTGTCIDPTDLSCSQLPVGTVFYTRAGYLDSGNLTVD